MKRNTTFERLLVALGIGLAVVTAAVVVFGGADKPASAGGSAQPVTGAHQIVISDFKFMPNTVEVKAGTKLTFVNHDASPHTATATADKVFDTGILRKGEGKTVTLAKAGTYDYFCELHPFMKATVKVVA